MKEINRLEEVLSEQKKKSKWLAENLGKDTATVSRWISAKWQLVASSGMDKRCQKQ